MIVRLLTASDASTAGRLHGVLEVPGGPSTPFVGAAQLLAALARLGREGELAMVDLDAPDAALSPPEAPPGS